MRSTRKPSALQRGFTLIEAMTAGLVLSIITIGLMSAWSVAGANVNDLVIREKAIWTLNGHMERISALYQFTDFGAFGVATSTAYDYPAAYNDTRMIFGTFADSAMAPPGTLPLLKPFAGEANGLVESPNAFEAKEGYPVVLFDSQLSSVRRNYVWIDRPKNIVGRLSWELTDIVVALCDSDNQPGGNQNCRCLNFAHNAADPAPGKDSGVFCKEIQLALEFPLRWNEADNTVKAMPQPTEILTLRTIVGRVQ
ncbi:MAG: hypothetical protein HOJ21_06210 [Alphaproteobacteria bacterium]|jgi:hypothetical protein|nr:hypothetical protein [Alphaproteobacteria bacterium]